MAAVKAVEDRGRWVSTADGRIGFFANNVHLFLRLPSGRLLTYAEPKYELTDTRFGRKLSLTFEGLNSQTHQWERQQLYGGKLTENAVQAICRDLLASAMLSLEKAG